MSENIEFTRNYSDHSTDQGFQFEFFCDRCGTGYRSPFQGFAAGAVSNALNTASSLFGGIFNSAATVGNNVRSAAWQKARDDAFAKAAQDIRPDFVQCPRCSTWVCKKSCWNTQKGLCKNCAPDLGVEMAAAQSSRTVEEIWAHSQVAESDRSMLKEESWRAGVRATCPKCNAPLAANAKFCPECGAPISQDKFCSNCGSKLQAGAKFCPDCGTKQE
ncbi:MAG TPA: zinc ribbon domain-containing protein [Anaerolineales bacterium]|nr:zinc ribbon domain-containing protein [Anaerolineales bacterium]